jgi:hypothetical protein
MLEKKFNALINSRLSVVEKKETPPPKAIIQRLEEKINALEERLSKTDAQCAPRLSIVSYKNKLFNLACEEILFHNDCTNDLNGYKVLPATIYLGGALFDEVHACISHYVNSQVATRTIQRGGKPDQFPGENTIEFIRQFTNIQRVIIHINCDLPAGGWEFGGSRQLDNLMHAIQNTLSFKNGYDIIIKGRYSQTFHNKLLTEMLKLNNYKRVEFDVDQTKLNGTYCDYWKLFMINGQDGRKLMKELQTHCEKHNIGFLSNIM